MLASDQFSDFFVAIANDPRINTTHISLFMALLQYWKEHHYESPVYVFSHTIMRMAKILSSATYHRSIRDLNDYGYIKYEPSYKRNKGSNIYILTK